MTKQSQKKPSTKSHGKPSKNRYPDHEFIEKINRITCLPPFLTSYEFIRIHQKDLMKKFIFYKRKMDDSIENCAVKDFWHNLQLCRKYGLTDDETHNAIIALLVNICQNHDLDILINVFHDNFFVNLLQKKYVSNQTICAAFLKTYEEKCKTLEMILKYQCISSILEPHNT